MGMGQRGKKFRSEKRIFETMNRYYIHKLKWCHR